MNDAKHSSVKIPFIDLREALWPILPEIKAAAGRVIDSGVYLRGPETNMFEGNGHRIAVNDIVLRVRAVRMR